MGRHQYFTLIASLPALRRFDRAERLPINRERLETRMKMLQPNDLDLFERAAAFLAWQRQSVTQTDQDMVDSFRRMEERIDHPALQAVFRFPVDQRTIMAALRRRHRGLPAPTPGEPWGVGHLTGHIERHWDAPDFKLGLVYSWIDQARQYMESGESLALERLLMGLLWDHVDRSVRPFEFGVDVVLAYVMKWDILQRWLLCDVEEASKRFEELVAEVRDEQRQLFS
jgi:hypothetical protein